MSQAGVSSIAQPELGGHSGGGTEAHNCLDKAEIISQTYTDTFEHEITARCTICNRVKIMRYVVELS